MESSRVPSLTMHSDEKTEHSASTVEVECGERDRKQVRDAGRLVYWIFLLHGVSILLQFNVVVTASSFFEQRFAATPYAKTFQNFFSIAYNIPNLVSLTLALLFTNRGFFQSRILCAISINVVVMMLLALSARTAALGEDELYFRVVLGLVAVTGASSALYQNGVFALVSNFPKIYVQAVMSGQGVAGAGIALAQLATTAGAGSGSSLTKADLDQSAFWYFIIAFAIAFASLIGDLVLIRLPFYKHYTSEKAVRDKLDPEAVPPTLRTVFKKIYPYAFAAAYAFLVTIAVFPSITTQILSVTPSASRFHRNDVFLAFHFLLFNVGDLLGRAIPGLQWMYTRRAWVLVVGALARTAFVPLFMVCNVMSPGRKMPTVINSDAAYFILVVLLGLSNGWVVSLAMMAAPNLGSVKPHEQNMIGSMMVTCLIAGLVVGSALSFPLRSAV
ncbi:uncharacterized protein VTP21DRAFT_9263 [Calcarisporiella thermophila]|uniref:uncharacterized protein n=1 Tax=Calcarisporiella thermophila TaxID=911321 RepID=UPI003743E650